MVKKILQKKNVMRWWLSTYIKENQLNHYPLHTYTFTNREKQEQREEGKKKIMMKEKNRKVRQCDWKIIALYY